MLIDAKMAAQPGRTQLVLDFLRRIAAPKISLARFLANDKRRYKIRIPFELEAEVGQFLHDVGSKTNPTRVIHFGTTIDRLLRDQVVEVDARVSRYFFQSELISSHLRDRCMPLIQQQWDIWSAEQLQWEIWPADHTTESPIPFVLSPSHVAAFFKYSQHMQAFRSSQRFQRLVAHAPHPLTVLAQETEDNIKSELLQSLVSNVFNRPLINDSPDTEQHTMLLYQIVVFVAIHETDVAKAVDLLNHWENRNVESRNRNGGFYFDRYMPGFSGLDKVQKRTIMDEALVMALRKEKIQLDASTVRKEKTRPDATTGDGKAPGSTQ